MQILVTPASEGLFDLVQLRLHCDGPEHRSFNSGQMTGLSAKIEFRQSPTPRKPRR